jgi:hypothetical protein
MRPVRMPGTTPGRGGTDVHDDWSAGPVAYGEHRHIGQANKQLAHARRVSLHQGSEGSTGGGTADSPARDPATDRDPVPERVDVSEPCDGTTTVVN